MISGLDVIILLIYIFFVVRGFNNGFFSTLITLLIIALSLYAAINLPHIVLSKLPGAFTDNDDLYATIITFVLFFLLGLYLKFRLLKPISNFKLFLIIDKGLGAILGFIKGTLVVFGICYILMFFSNSLFVKKSKIFPYIEQYSSKILHYVQSNNI